jgi:nickel-dependent lactate racemase
MEQRRLYYDATNFLDLPVTIPLERIVRVEPKQVFADSAPDQLLKEAFANPIEASDLTRESMKHAAVIFSDETRLPSPYLGDLLRALTEKAEDVSLIVACGTHELPSEDYAKRIVGEKNLSCSVIFSSTKNNRSRFSAIGQTTRGTILEVNEEILNRDFVLSSLCVRPHYFAGFEGGAKAILPGCSSLRTTSRNHSYVIGNSSARELVIKNNPVREDINEVPRLLERHGIKYRIADFVADTGNAPFKIGYGDPVKTHSFLSSVAKEIHTVKAPATSLAITVADGSLGKTLYQATKAFSLTTNVLKRKRDCKSSVVLIASLRDGVGSTTWTDELVRYASKPSAEIIQDLRSRAKKGEFNETLQKINRFAIDCETTSLRVVSPEAPKKVERLLNETKILFARELYEATEDFKKSNDKIVLVPKGSSTVPIQTD